MYRVLIIDDEEPLIEAIKILGDWDALGVTEIAEAHNGREGIAQVRQHRPDLIIVDMKMPEMNGTEFLELIRKEYPDIPSIVISGYNDFDYTRQAIKSGSVDYLLKPVNKQELNQTLAEVIASIEEKKRERNEHIDRDITLNMSLPKLKEKIIMSIIENRHNNLTDKASLTMIGANNAQTQFGLALIRVMNLQEVLSKRFKGDTDLLYFSLANVINEEVGSDEVTCFSFNHPKREREIIIVYTYDVTHRETMTFIAQSSIKRAITNLNTLFGLVATAGIGGIGSEIGQLPKAYTYADQVVNSINLINLSEFMVSTAIAQGGSDSLSIAGRIPFIRHALEEGNPSYADTILAEYITKMKNSGYYSLGMAARTIREFTLLLHEMALELGVPGVELVMGYENALKARDVTTDYATFTQFEQLLIHILNYYGELIRKSIHIHQHFDIHDIKEYIHNHYYEEIRISIFTERYYLSREYLMKLFKQEFGSGIYEYVQKVRMEKATELLMDPRMKIQDISDMLGYKDKNYFSKAFKNYYQLSPSDYRATILKI